MTKKARITAAAAAAVITAGALAGCTQKALEPFRDAPVSGHDNSPAQIIEMPDGFSNLASKCDGHGHRVYVAYHGDSAYGAITAIDDPTCR